MKILVFIKEVPDIRIPVEYDEPARKVRPDWNVWILNPADRSAIEMALKIKEADKDTEITLVHLGPAGGERWIREGLAMGCDKGVRIFDEGLDQIGPRGKALIFSRIARILGFDLIMTGTRSQDTGNGQVGVLIASDLGVPYAGSVVGLEMGVRERAAVVTRRLAQGYHERIETPFPLVAAMEAYEESSRSAALPALLDATEKEIERLDLAAIGIPQALIRQKESILSPPSLRFPKARLKYIAAPDSTLPALMRIRKLIEGTVSTREGKVVSGEDDVVVEELFQALLRDGWLGHLAKK